MKKKQLRKIIKEETKKCLKEYGEYKDPEKVASALEGISSELDLIMTAFPEGVGGREGRLADDIEALHNLAKRAQMTAMDVAHRKIAENKKKDLSEISKPYGGEKPDFDSWPQERIKKYWETLSKKHKTFESKVEAVSSFADNPEAFIAALEKRATNGWPAEK